MRLSPDLPPVRDFETLAKELSTFGAILLREVGYSAVIAVFRLAIAEATRSPEVAIESAPEKSKMRLFGSSVRF
jgi:hypothetical protein